MGNPSDNSTNMGNPSDNSTNNHLCISIDYDGCYDYSRKRGEERFAQYINSYKELNQYKDITIFIGSSRQSYAIDRLNNLGHNNGSCFTAFENLAEKTKCGFNTLLLADIYAELENGTSFKKATETAIKKDAGDHAQFVFDEHKISLLYAQIHEALKTMEGKITFQFVDDRGDIIKAINDFYSKHTELIPTNVTLKLIQYPYYSSTKEIEISGEGQLDPDYKKTVRDMARIAQESWEHDYSHGAYFEKKVTPEKLNMMKLLRPDPDLSMINSRENLQLFVEHIRSIKKCEVKPELQKQLLHKYIQFRTNDNRKYFGCFKLFSKDCKIKAAESELNGTEVWNGRWPAKHQGLLGKIIGLDTGPVRECHINRENNL